ncbi:TonB-dependent receptor [Pedobacter africanus]|uniref:Outer membrane receptor for ferrienterochelin and colicins n=1 Tax=Pedobacter africanus TaxID=151894 RepID=A0A1W2CYC1_9SPHI|nr:TonB-dependent receptor [Pedobacter africanus]SMC89852.1 Outer membrane receptor for ferrienterochelin and colicins [Pedobacter africanus]
MKRILIFLLFVVAAPFALLAQQRFTISGTVRDASSGETLIGATVKLQSTTHKAGIATNAYGFYSLTAAEDTYDLLVSYSGYRSFTQKITLNKVLKVNIELSAAADLQEVVISAGDKKNENVKSPQMGLSKIDMKTLDNVPVLLGEKDVLKTVQLLPGVKAGGEGNTGFFVRGGASDQNLILLDEATVYNSSHLLGFFSTFNADAIKDVSLYKGGMPAQYGGRLSSVLDVKMQDGNDKEFKVEGGLGLIASRIKAEGPIVKNKSSFMVSARRTYIDLLLKASGDSALKNNTLNFYDINAKINYKFDDKNTLFLSGYFGQDNIGIKDLFANDWGNTTATVRFNHVFNSRLFSNTSFIYNKYSYAIELLDENSNAKVNSLIRDYNFKEDLQYYADNHILRFGLHATHHRIAPSDIRVSANSSFNPLSIENRYGLEFSAYISDEWTVTDRLNLLYGLRLSQFSLLGPGTMPTYNTSGEVTSSASYKKGEFVKNYFNLEPRFSASYSLNNKNSIKASYNRNTQNIHILSNSGTASPTDQYVMSSNNIKPEIADQAALGYFRNTEDNGFEFSAEIYYKWMQNQIDYKDGAELTANADVEVELLYGKGRAYGLELYGKKTKGKFTGWISYTLSKTERQFDQINNGKYFNARQDRTHDLALVGMYNLGRRWSVSANYIYSTGNAVTYPAGKYNIGGLNTYYYTERNANRMPHTSRLDIGATLKAKETKRFQSSWTFSVYNALNRKNPYAIQFRDKENDPTRTEAVQTSLFGIIPSITYNFKF